ncbi:hypothetical protein [Shewanella nanhaiensis]|uniref:DUF4412 domain-containing protein n=1 Tax=Shewanella nanhaiensis TaxID=2864872 RepID=A0ABS7E3L1_9GAMM|nr:hypothetical protein [Shewanella nanhaiensis]MBW8183751.1 hypothetical protein [Shewanella nanhaiensis]
MKKMLFLFIFYSTSSLASAPFGLEWGADLSEYGVTNVNGQTVTLLTNKLPIVHPRAENYFLKGRTELGLSLIRMSSNVYDVQSKELEMIHNEIREELIQSGYRFTRTESGTFGTYQCILQSNCYGNSWHAESKQGNTVKLLTQGKNRKEGYILVEFSAPELLEKENQLELQAFKAKNTSIAAAF